MKQNFALFKRLGFMAVAMVATASAALGQEAETVQIRDWTV